MKDPPKLLLGVLDNTFSFSIFSNLGNVDIEGAGLG